MSHPSALQAPPPDGRVVIAVGSTQLGTPAQRAVAAAVAGLPLTVVDARVAAGSAIALSEPLPRESAAVRLPTVTAHVPAAQLGVPGTIPPMLPIAMAGSGVTLLVVAGALAAWVEPLAGVAAGVAALGDLAAAAWLAQRVRVGADGAALVAAQRAAVDALPGERAAWLAVGGLRRAVLDLPDSLRTDVHAALDALEARLAAGADARRLVAEVQEAVDDLRAGRVLGQRGAPAPAALAQRAAALRAQVERGA